MNNNEAIEKAQSLLSDANIIREDGALNFGNGSALVEIVTTIGSWKECSEHIASPPIQNKKDVIRAFTSYLYAHEETIMNWIANDLEDSAKRLINPPSKGGYTNLEDKEF